MLAMRHIYGVYISCNLSNLPHSTKVVTALRKFFKGQIRLMDILKDWKENHQLIVPISSHDLNHVTEVFERIVLIEKGIFKMNVKTNASTLKELED